MRYRICIVCGVDHKGVEFIGDKQIHSLTYNPPQGNQELLVVRDKVG